MKYWTEEGGWFTRETRGSFGVGLWKDISKEGNKLKQECYFVLGNDNRVKFWEDIWCGESTLSEMFPSVYALVGTKRAMGANVWDTTSGEGTWKLRFARSFNDWEMDEVENFINLVNNKKTNQMVKDRLLWKGDKNGIFSVKASIAHIEGGNLKAVPLKVIL